MTATLTKRLPSKTPFDKALSALLEYNRKHPDVANAVAEAIIRNKTQPRG